MEITIIGTGYVGLITGLTFAYLGNRVNCLDVDKEKVSKLNMGIMPIYEPWLQELMELSKQNIIFTSDYKEAVSSAEVIFITVGTPSLPDGTPDMKYAKQASKEIGECMGDKDLIIINKSTVPIGSGNWVESLIRDAYEKKHNKKISGHLSVVSNPEFLKEGAAIYDSFFPNRIVIGSNNPQALSKITQLYIPIIEQSFTPPPFLKHPENLKQVPLVATDLTSAELIKYTANAFLSLKISFINEIACVAEKVGADIRQISKGIGFDERIGSKFLSAGIGWGGSCFGKDTAALSSTAREYGIEMHIVEASRKVNYGLRNQMIEKIQEELKILKGANIGIMGLAFKPFTDDLRDSPAIDMVRNLIKRGAKVKIHDPIAMERAKSEPALQDASYANSLEELFDEADALVLVTDWPLYKDINWEGLSCRMRRRIIFDGRNFLDKERLENVGFRYRGVGR